MKTTEKKLTQARDRLSTIRSQQTLLREEELKIREWVADSIHDGRDGAKTVTIGGVKVTVTRKINLTIKREDAERLSAENGALALEVLRWNPEVRAGVYRKNQEELEDYITEKDAPPDVKFA